MRTLLRPAAVALLLAGSGCATLSGVGIQAPRFAVADDQPSELRLLGPSMQQPLGGASIRLYARVENPNPIGITLASLTGMLRLEGLDAAEADFPLGLPLAAGQAIVIPLDLAISFASLPGLADVVTRAATVGQIGYRGSRRSMRGFSGSPASVR